MNWALIAGMALMVIGLFLVRRWLLLRTYRQWHAGRLADRRAKVQILMIAFGPLVVATLIVGALAPWPLNVFVLLAVIATLVMNIGLGGAIFDYQARYVVTREARPERDDP